MSNKKPSELLKSIQDEEVDEIISDKINHAIELLKVFLQERKQLRTGVYQISSAHDILEELLFEPEEKIAIKVDENFIINLSIIKEAGQFFASWNADMLKDCISPTIIATAYEEVWNIACAIHSLYLSEFNRIKNYHVGRLEEELRRVIEFKAKHE